MYNYCRSLDSESVGELLVVIDMQPNFLYSKDGCFNQTIVNVAREIRLARGRENYIFFVEYFAKNLFDRSDKSNSLGSTIDKLKNITKNYNKVFTVYKNQNDGGNEIYNLINKIEINPRIINVCGVYSNACVSETVNTLSIKLKDSRIKVIKDAVQATMADEWNQFSAFDYMQTMQNVELI